jgi:uncharacterized OB-fold protein
MTVQRSIDATWWAGIEDGKILFRRCGRCAAANFYPRLACVQCLSPDLNWQECSGFGTIYACTRVHRAPDKEHAADVPYTVVLADMDEGFRMLVKLKQGGPGEAAVGARVKVGVEAGSEGRPRPYAGLLGDGS